MSNLIRSKKSNNLEVKFQQEYIYLTANPKKCSPLVTSSKILQTNQRQCSASSEWCDWIENFQKLYQRIQALLGEHPCLIPLGYTVHETHLVNF